MAAEPPSPAVVEALAALERARAEVRAARVLLDREVSEPGAKPAPASRFPALHLGTGAVLQPEHLWVLTRWSLAVLLGTGAVGYSTHASVEQVFADALPALVERAVQQAVDAAIREQLGDPP